MCLTTSNINFHSLDLKIIHKLLVNSQYIFLHSDVHPKRCKYTFKINCMNIVVTCPAVQLSHGTIKSTKQLLNGAYPVNTTLTFSCDYSYRITFTYSSRATCLATEKWSQVIPYCKYSNKIVYFI